MSLDSLDRRAWCAVVWILMVGGGVAAPPEPIRPAEKIPLFDGGSLDRLYTWLVDDHQADPLRVFTRVDQVDGAPAIRISGERWGGLVTRNAYQDYRLVVEFRWGTITWGNRMNGARDSGILLHCQGRDGNTAADFNGPWMASVETQMIEGGTGDFILVSGFDERGDRIGPSVSVHTSQDRDGEWVYDPWAELKQFTSGRINWYGRDPDWSDRLGFRGKKDVENPAGEWNRIEVICRGGDITNTVNGRIVNRLTGSTFRAGKIMFQSEGAEVFFRRIELHPLD